MTIRRTGAILLLLAASLSQAQTPTSTQGIYSCVDAKGRRLTSDRPIPACLDREQKVLNPSGTVRGVVGPSMTGDERAAMEARQRREAEEKAQHEEEQRRERALLLRYPNKERHDKERADALAQIDVVRRAAMQRIEELKTQRKELDTELEFYAQRPDRVPPSLKRLIEDNTLSLDAQWRFLADQDAEKERLNRRFDDELARLQPMWQTSKK